MQFIKRSNRSTKFVLCVALLLVIYGYLCRLAGIYFFWESKTIGCLLFIIGLIVFLFGNIKYKRPNDKHSVAEKIVIGILLLILLTQGVLVFFIPNSNAYQAVKEYVNSDENLKAEIGEVRGISIIPIGGLAVSSSEDGEAGEGNICITVKGIKKYIDLNVIVNKEIHTDWTVTINE